MDRVMLNFSIPRSIAIIGTVGWQNATPQKKEVNEKEE
jgi:hypothetical protein